MGGHPGPATSARGCVRCKRQQHPPCPAHPVYSHRECLVPCRMVAMPATPGKEPPGVATRMPLAQKDKRRAALYSLPAPRPTTSACRCAMADLREGLRAVQAPQDRKPPGSQRIQPRREPKRVPTRTAPHARPTTPHSKTNYRLAVLREGLSPRRRHRKQRAQLPPHPERSLGEWGRGCHFAQKDNIMLAVACHPFTWTKSRQGERVTIHTRNRPG